MTDRFFVLRIGGSWMRQGRYVLWRHNNYDHLLYDYDQMPIKGYVDSPDSPHVTLMSANIDPRDLKNRYLRVLERDDKTVRIIGPVKEIMTISNPVDVPVVARAELKRAA